MQIESVLKESKIRDLKLERPSCLAPSTRLAEAIDVMRAGRKGYILGCEGHKLQGILTERDVLTKIAGESVSLDSPIAGFMTLSPTSIDGDASVWAAIRLMDEGDYRHLPVVNDAGDVEGVITTQDVVEFLAELFPTEILNLPPDSDQAMDSQEGE
jgi:CBS domain-containing protein